MRRILDVGCGTGGWLIETAQAYPMIEKLVGVDISEKMLDYARAQAETQLLDGRIHFQTTDALQALPFSDAYFDLVNQRLGYSWLRTFEWRDILLEYQRVTRPGGIIRITEADLAVQSNSPALTQLLSINLEATHNSGRLFTPSGDGIIAELVHLLTRYGIEDVQTRAQTLTYRAGTLEGRQYFENLRYGLRVLLPFFQKYASVPRDYHEISQQALKEMQAPDFVATQSFLTAWGTKSKCSEGIE